MRYVFTPSFDRSLRGLDARQKEELKTACLAFIDLLEEHTPMPGGIGLKRLQGDFWEVRRDLHNRILFRWKQDLIEFVLAGDHDSIKDFLKNC